jgi:predicted small lipoprotein YifL
MKKILSALLVVSTILALAACGGSGKPVSAAPAPLGAPPAPKVVPAIDGVVKDGEYAQTFDFAPFKVWETRTKDVVRLAVSAKSAGWVAIGVGSRRMNSAEMFLGEVVNGKAIVTEQVGRGHGHRDADTASRLAVKSAVKRDGDTLTLELEFPAAKVAPADVKELSIILGLSGDPSFAAQHDVRRSAAIQLE